MSETDTPPSAETVQTPANSGDADLRSRPAPASQGHHDANTAAPSASTPGQDLTQYDQSDPRALTWDRTHLTEETIGGVVLPPSIEVWRSVRRQRDTMTKRSRRAVALPARCVDALPAHRSDQDRRQAVDGQA
jgi:hypothetical protein